MRWNSRKPVPQLFGRYRVIKSFAWLPTKVGSKWVWLEPYCVQQKWWLIHSVTIWGCFPIRYPGWIEVGKYLPAKEE